MKYACPLVCVILIVGGLYIGFVEAPELTQTQRLIEYWWFYLPVISLMALLAVKFPWRQQ